jgi:hypothetical protein
MLYQFNDTFEKRFWSKVRITPGCWVWTANKINKGYGVVGPGGCQEYILSHRASWQLHNGEIPDGLCVLHRCDNPACVNPDHLWLGTHQHNMLDKCAKGRSFPPGWLDNVRAANVKSGYARRRDKSFAVQ